MLYGSSEEKIDRIGTDTSGKPWEAAMARAVEIIALQPSGLENDRDVIADEVIRLTHRLYNARP